MLLSLMFRKNKGLAWLGWAGRGLVRTGTVRGHRDAMSDFPKEDVVRVLEDVQAFLCSFRGSEGRVGEAVHLAQLVNNLLVKVAKNVDS